MAKLDVVDGYRTSLIIYKYLGITVEGGKHGGFKSMGDRMKEANRLLDMQQIDQGQICDWNGRMEDTDC